MAKKNNILAVPETENDSDDTGQPKMRKGAVYTVVKDFDAQTVTWVFADKSLSNIVLNMATLNAETNDNLRYHGASQKGSDPAALAKGATPSDKHAAISAVVSRIQDNQWRKPAGERVQSVTLLIRAIAELQGKSEDVITAWLSGKSDEDKKALRTAPAIAAIIARLRAESGKSADVDANALLAELA